MWKWYLFFYPTLLIGGLNTEGDWQFWTKDGIQGPINPSTNWTVQAEERFGNGCSTLYHWFVEASIDHRFDPTWSGEIGYRDNHRRVADGEWSHVPSPFTTLTFTQKLAEWTASFRQRWSYEFNQKTAPHTSWEYRQRLQVVSPWKWTRLNLQPFVSDEVFFRKQEGFSRNRFQSGLKFALNAHWKGEFYYMLQSTRRQGIWTDINAVNFNLYKVF